PQCCHLASLPTRRSSDLLTPTKVTFRRMRTVIDVARMEMENSFERLREQPLDDAYRALVSLSGVGHWTAAWTLARGTGHFIYFGGRKSTRLNSSHATISY